MIPFRTVLSDYNLIKSENSKYLPFFKSQDSVKSYMCSCVKGNPVSLKDITFVKVDIFNWIL